MNWHSSNTTDLVDILEGESEWLVGRSGWWDDGVEGFEHGLAGELALLDFLGPSLVPLHVGGLLDLVVSDNELLDTEGVGEEGVLSGLAVLGDSSFELTNTGGDDEDGAIGLGGTGDHVLDEITVTGGVNDGDVELVGLELPEGDIDGDTSFSLGLQLVQNPSVLEGTFTHLMGFLLELLDGSLVDTSALVDEVTGSSGPC